MSVALVQRYATVLVTQSHWSMLEQCQLNTHNALNLFLRGTSTYSSGGQGRFEFEPGNGCQWTFLPVGLFYLVQVQGTCGPHRLQKTWMVGARTSAEPLLALDQQVHEMSLRQSAIFSGPIVFNSATQSQWRPSPEIAPLAELGDLPLFSFHGLAEHLQLQGSQLWEDQLKTIFPDLRVVEREGQLALASLSSGGPTLVRGGSLALSGTLSGEGPYIFLAQDVRGENATLNNAWILASGNVEFRGKTNADHVHVVAERIVLHDQLDFQNSSLSALAWSQDHGRMASVHLYGEGFFHGSLLALPMDERLRREFGFQKSGQAIVFKESPIRSEGLIFCENVVSIRGSHAGSVRAGIWEYFEHNSRFVGRLEDVSLTQGLGGFTVWGLGSKSGEPVYSLPIKAL